MNAWKWMQWHNMRMHDVMMTLYVWMHTICIDNDDICQYHQALCIHNVQTHCHSVPLLYLHLSFSCLSLFSLALTFLFSLFLLSRSFSFLLSLSLYFILSFSNLCTACTVNETKQNTKWDRMMSHENWNKRNKTNEMRWTKLHLAPSKYTWVTMKCALWISTCSYRTFIFLVPTVVRWPANNRDSITVFLMHVDTTFSTPVNSKICAACFPCSWGAVMVRQEPCR